MLAGGRERSRRDHQVKKMAFVQALICLANVSDAPCIVMYAFGTT